MNRVSLDIHDYSLTLTPDAHADGTHETRRGKRLSSSSLNELKAAADRFLDLLVLVLK